jgi:hypothetical protein
LVWSPTATLPCRYFGLLYTIEIIVAAFWVKLPMQGYAASRIDLMILAGATALYFLRAERWSIDSIGWKSQAGKKQMIAGREFTC